MLIGYSMPTVSAVGITGGTWLTADGGAACCDGKPARRARFEWSGGGSTSSYAAITLTFAAAAPLRVLAALGLSVPVGTRIEFLGPSNASLGGDTGNARTVRMPDGSVGVFAVGADDGIPDGACTVRIYNDCNGSTWATGGTVVDVGELVAMPGVDVVHGSEWSDDPQDPTQTQLTMYSQPNMVRRSSYNILDVPLVASQAAQAYGGALANGMDWVKLRTALAGTARSVVVIRSSAPVVAQYGNGRVGPIRHLGGDYFAGQLRHQEIPAR